MGLLLAHELYYMGKGLVYYYIDTHVHNIHVHRVLYILMLLLQNVLRLQ